VTAKIRGTATPGKAASRMDKELTIMLTKQFQAMHDFQVVLGESLIVHNALHRAMCEVHPGFDAVYHRFMMISNQEKLAKATD
jgi:hypothetical protein